MDRLVHAFHACLGAHIRVDIGSLDAAFLLHTTAYVTTLRRVASLQVHAHECRPWVDQNGVPPSSAKQRVMSCALLICGSDSKDLRQFIRRVRCD